MQGERDVTVGAPPRDAAGAAVNGGRDAAAVEHQDRPAAVLYQHAECLEQRCREGVAGLAPQVDEPDARHRRADASRERRAPQARPALRPRRRRAVHRDRPLEGGALGRDRARVVARVRLLLVGGVVLLVDDDQADPAHRREHRRAGADHDPGLPLARSGRARRVARRRRATSAGSRPGRRTGSGSAPPSAAPARSPAPARLSQPPPECRGAGLEVHLRLAAAGRSLEQDVLADALVERGDDSLDRSLLARRECRGLRLAAEGLAGRRRRPLAPRRAATRGATARTLGRVWSRSSPRARGRGRRAARGSRRAASRLGRGRSRAEPPRRRPRPPPGRAPAEAQRDDRALRNVLGDVVGERPGEGAGRDEGMDGGEGHRRPTYSRVRRWRPLAYACGGG